LARGLKIKLSTEVTEIDHSGPRIKVKTSSGRSFTANQVVVTVPLTILRTLTFNPPLPGAKQTAMDRIGVGILDKLYLEFDRCFWNPGADWLVRVDSEWTYTMNCLKHNTGKPILLLFTHGAQSKRLSELSDA
jgi:polyamine oxidase